MNRFSSPNDLDIVLGGKTSNRIQDTNTQLKSSNERLRNLDNSIEIEKFLTIPDSREFTENEIKTLPLIGKILNEGRKFLESEILIHNQDHKSCIDIYYNDSMIKHSLTGSDKIKKLILSPFGINLDKNTKLKVFKNNRPVNFSINSGFNCILNTQFDKDVKCSLIHFKDDKIKIQTKNGIIVATKPYSFIYKNPEHYNLIIEDSPSKESSCFKENLPSKDSCNSGCRKESNKECGNCNVSNYDINFGTKKINWYPILSILIDCNECSKCDKASILLFGLINSEIVSNREYNIRLISDNSPSKFDVTSVKSTGKDDKKKCEEIEIFDIGCKSNLSESMVVSLKESNTECRKVYFTENRVDARVEYGYIIRSPFSFPTCSYDIFDNNSSIYIKSGSLNGINKDDIFTIRVGHTTKVKFNYLETRTENQIVLNYNIDNFSNEDIRLNFKYEHYGEIKSYNAGSIFGRQIPNGIIFSFDVLKAGNTKGQIIFII